MKKIDRIKEVLSLDEWRAKQKKIYRRWLISILLSIILIGSAIYYWINYS